MGGSVLFPQSMVLAPLIKKVCDSTIIKASSFMLWSVLVLETEWSESSSHSAVFSMQGRRPGNEDTAIMETVKTVDGLDEGADVQIWAVMDGHGGDVRLI